MRTRRLTKADLPVLFDAEPALLGPGFVAERAALRTWETMMESFGFASAVVEHKRAGSSKIVGVGAAVLVSDAFGRAEAEDPRPGFVGRVLSHHMRGSGHVLSREAIADENSGRGVTIAVLIGRWITNDLTDEQIEPIRLALSEDFLELHAGYHVKRILTELRDQQDLTEARLTKIYRILAHSEGNGWPALGVIEEEDIAPPAYSLLRPLFSRSVPVLRLRPNDQDLLIAAVAGATDPELANILRISVSAVKKRWEEIYNRVAEAALWGNQFVAPADGKRGPQKRHYLLAYLRQHPEELRPFRANARSSTAVGI